LQAAQALFAESGWKPEVENGKRVLKNAKGEIFTFNIVIDWDAYERIALPYKEQLELLGVAVTIRTIDVSQYARLQKEFDYDVIVSIWGQSLSPGNEQTEFWTSAYADKPGSKNYYGIKNPAVDADRKSLVAACQALDRVLMWNHYGVPMWFKSGERLAHWKRVAHTETLPLFGLGYPATWWFDEKANASISKS
jgi:microcin C transport system substrate-binding protein